MALVVNGERIDDSEIAREVERLRPRYEQVFADKAPQEREEQLLHWSRENVIERTLLRQEAAKDCQPASEAEIIRNALQNCSQIASLFCELLVADFQGLGHVVKRLG